MTSASGSAFFPSKKKSREEERGERKGRFWADFVYLKGGVKDRESDCGRTDGDDASELEVGDDVAVDGSGGAAGGKGNGGGDRRPRRLRH